MLEAILGSKVREKVLLFLNAEGKGYAREIARSVGAPLDSVQKQLKRLEHGKVLKSWTEGKTVIYAFSSRCEYMPELRHLLEKASAAGLGYRKKSMEGERNRNWELAGGSIGNVIVKRR